MWLVVCHAGQVVGVHEGGCMDGCMRSNVGLGAHHAGGARAHCVRLSQSCRCRTMSILMLSLHAAAQHACDLTDVPPQARGRRCGSTQRVVLPTRQATPPTSGHRCGARECLVGRCAKLAVWVVGWALRVAG